MAKKDLQRAVTGEARPRRFALLVKSLILLGIVSAAVAGLILANRPATQEPPKSNAPPISKTTDVPGPERAQADPPAPRPRTHHWWHGVGPQVYLPLTEDEKRSRFVGDLSTLERARREHYEKELASRWTAFVTIRLSADRKAVEETFVTLYPPDPRRAPTSSDEMLRVTDPSGKNPVRHDELWSDDGRSLAHDGRFTVSGFWLVPGGLPVDHLVLKPELARPRRESADFNVRASPEGEAPVRHVLAGTLTGDELRGSVITSDRGEQALEEGADDRDIKIYWQATPWEISDEDVDGEINRMRTVFRR
jgi:hypothetical protein